MVLLLDRVVDRDAPPLTVGVEEEFLLLDPDTGAPVPRAGALLRLLADEPGPQLELMQFQFETATPVCTTLDQVRAELLRLRRLASAGATALGCRLVATGVAPYGTPGLSALTDGPRYRGLAHRFPSLTGISGTCGCHVHVGVPSRDLGVSVLVRLRPWLATLLALSVNSPLVDGRDRAWGSERYRIVSRWPTARPPARWSDEAGYDASVRRLVQRGAAIDPQSVYFLARLSPRYPTVEIRVADVCLDVDTAVLLTALVRALVATALREAVRGAPLPGLPDGWVAGSLTAAAHYGLGGAAGRLGPEHRPRPLYRLVEHVGAALDAAGDRAAVARLLGGLYLRGTGAEAQRRQLAEAGSPADFVAALAGATVAAPDGSPQDRCAASIAACRDSL